MSQLTIRPLNKAIGAEVEGLQPRIPLDGDTLTQLRAAFDERGVLLFRGLDIDEDFQRYLVYALIGEPVDPEDKTLQLVSNRTKGGSAPYGRLLFHCDRMWSFNHQPVISLYGYHVEPPGAPTEFIHMGHAWNTLPEHLKKRVESLEARHGFDQRYPNRGGDADVADGQMPAPRSTTRPVAYKHPRTGQTMLYISQQATIEIMDLPHEENEELLEELFKYLYASDAVLAHEWREGDLVIWDNVATQHGRRTVQLEGPERTLRKVVGPVVDLPGEMQKPVYSKLAAAGR